MTHIPYGEHLQVEGRLHRQLRILKEANMAKPVTREASAKAFHTAQHGDRITCLCGAKGTADKSDSLRSQFQDPVWERLPGYICCWSCHDR